MGPQCNTAGKVRHIPQGLRPSLSATAQWGAGTAGCFLILVSVCGAPPAPFPGPSDLLGSRVLFCWQRQSEREESPDTQWPGGAGLPPGLVSDLHVPDWGIWAGHASSALRKEMGRCHQCSRAHQAQGNTAVSTGIGVSAGMCSA